jgi:hypothetical protein
MSLVEPPLNLISLPNIKMGLDGGDGRRAFIPTERSFFLDIHLERSVDWEERKESNRELAES